MRPVPPKKQINKKPKRGLQPIQGVPPKKLKPVKPPKEFLKPGRPITKPAPKPGRPSIIPVNGIKPPKKIGGGRKKILY